MEPYLHSFYPVRFSDCDPFRHLNNASYINYFLNAREDQVKQAYNMDLNDFYRRGQGWVIAQHDILYVRPASLGETICIRTGLLDAGPEHLLVEMLMLDEQQRQLKSLLHTRFVPISLTDGKKQPHSAEFIEFIYDKKIPGLDGNIPSAIQRVQYWGKELKREEGVKESY
jgi:YbgC/YbaW family acyl-CoA thioester hydrolase